MTQEKNIESLSLAGGQLCLDFINTVHDRTVDDVRDYLNSYADVLLWCRKTGALSPGEIEELNEMPSSATKGADAALDRVKEGREILYLIFRSVVRKEQISDAAAAFNRLLRHAMAHEELKFDGGHEPLPGWQGGPNPDKPLFAVVRSARDLLLSGELHRVKECKACGWLFFDKSKNNSRRWCDMQTCGSAVKARRYYRRKKLRNDQQDL